MSDNDIINHREAKTHVLPLKLTGQCAELNSRVAGDLGGVQFNPVVLINSSLLALWHKSHNGKFSCHSAKTKLLMTDRSADLGFQKVS